GSLLPVSLHRPDFQCFSNDCTRVGSGSYRTENQDPANKDCDRYFPCYRIRKSTIKRGIYTAFPDTFLMPSCPKRPTLKSSQYDIDKIEQKLCIFVLNPL